MPDSIFVVIVAGTVAGVLGLLWAAIEMRELLFLVAAVGVLVVGAYSALVVIKPTLLGVDLEPECRAAQEAVGGFTFVFKVVLRCAPLLFAAGIIFTTYLLLEATVRIMTADGPALMMAYSVAMTGLGGLFAAIAIPIYVYLLLLMYYLTLDVISAIVSLPGKLDLIAERMSESGRPASLAVSLTAATAALRLSFPLPVPSGRLPPKRSDSWAERRFPKLGGAHGQSQCRRDRSRARLLRLAQNLRRHGRRDRGAEGNR